MIFLHQSCITNQCDAANILHKIYNKNSIIECELIAYALDITLGYIKNKCIKHIIQPSK